MSDTIRELLAASDRDAAVKLAAIREIAVAERKCAVASELSTAGYAAGGLGALSFLNEYRKPKKDRDWSKPIEHAIAGGALGLGGSLLQRGLTATNTPPPPPAAPTVLSRLRRQLSDAADTADNDVLRVLNRAGASAAGTGEALYQKSRTMPYTTYGGAASGAWIGKRIAGRVGDTLRGGHNYDDLLRGWKQVGGLDNATLLRTVAPGGDDATAQAIREAMHKLQGKGRIGRWWEGNRALSGGSATRLFGRPGITVNTARAIASQAPAVPLVSRTGRFFKPALPLLAGVLADYLNDAQK